MSYRKALVAFCCSSLAVIFAGCGGGDSVEAYHLSGKVTFDGKPIPTGQIYFMPDTNKGNSGPAGFAKITDGVYDTSLEGGKPQVGGAMIVKIEGMSSVDQSAGGADDDSAEAEAMEEVTLQALFPTFQMEAELPKEEDTKDFDVPAHAGDVEPVKGEETRTPGGV